MPEEIIGQNIVAQQFEINGVIGIPHGKESQFFDQMTLTDSFLTWIVSQNWEFAGTIGEVDQKGNYIGD